MLNARDVSLFIQVRHRRQHQYSGRGSQEAGHPEQRALYQYADILFHHMRAHKRGESTRH